MAAGERLVSAGVSGVSEGVGSGDLRLRQPLPSASRLPSRYQRVRRLTLFVEMESTCIWPMSAGAAGASTTSTGFQEPGSSFVVNDCFDVLNCFSHSEIGRLFASNPS